MVTSTSIGKEGVEKIIRSAVEKCISEIKDNSRRAGQVATGKTLRSLEYTLQNKGTAYVAKILARPYFGSLETGRGHTREERETRRASTTGSSNG